MRRLARRKNYEKAAALRKMEQRAQIGDGIINTKHHEFDTAFCGKPINDFSNVY
jgi:hypothetical protein